MKKIHKFFPIFAAILQGGLLLTCNYSTAIPRADYAPCPTLTPPVLDELLEEDLIPVSTFIAEEFDSGIPDEWESSSGWYVNNGKLSSMSPEAVLVIPGEWQDKSLFLRLRFESENLAVRINQSETGAYAVDMSLEKLSVSWHPGGGEEILLESTPIEIDYGWHILVLRQTHGFLEVLVDEESLLRVHDLGLSPSGSLALSKSSPGLVEIEYLVLAPAGMGP